MLYSYRIFLCPQKPQRLPYSYGSLLPADALPALRGNILRLAFPSRREYKYSTVVSYLSHRSLLRSLRSIFYFSCVAFSSVPAHCAAGMFLDSEPEAQTISHPEGLRLTGSSGGAILGRPTAGYKGMFLSSSPSACIAKRRRAVQSSVADTYSKWRILLITYVVFLLSLGLRMGSYRLYCSCVTGAVQQLLSIPQDGCFPHEA